MARRIARKPRIRKARATTKPSTSHRVPPKPASWNCAKGNCRYCGEPIIENDKVNTRKHWHYDCAMIWVVMNNPTEARKHVHKRDNYTCQHCHTHNRYGAFEVDHIKPLYEANGDPTFWQPDNLTLLCGPCHQTKTREDMVRWHERRRQEAADLQPPPDEDEL